MAPRFCNKCGTPWDPAWSTCAACTQRPPPHGITAAQPTPQDRPIRSVLLLYFVLLATTIVTSGVTAIWGGPENEYAQLIGEVACSLIDTAIVLVWCILSWPLVRPPLKHSPDPGWYAIAAGLSLITVSLGVLVVWVLVRWLGVEEIRCLGPFIKAGWGLGPAALVVCVQPALIEELAFRGIILDSLRRILSDREAIGVSAVLFMILHLTILSLPHLLLLGLVLGYLRIRTRSLYPGMVLHFTHNLLVLLAETWNIP